MELRNLRHSILAVITAIGASFAQAQGHTDEISYRSDYWKYSEVPLLGQLVPVNQINLQKGVQLFDVETIGRRWQGVTNPFDTMGLGEFDTQNQEAILRFRYAYPLTRYTYIGTTLGVAQRTESDLYNESGAIDPEFFVGHHIPWRNGDFRLAFTASPSLGISEVNRDITVNSETAKGNLYRGGWSVRPEAAMTLRSGSVLFGAEVSYLYFGERVQDETLTVSAEALNQPETQQGLFDHFLGVDSGVTQASNANIFDLANFQGTETVRTRITGGHTWAVKGLLEFPDWQRLGAELIYGQVGASTRENDFGQVIENEGGDFQEVRVYARYRHSDQFSVTPLVSWMPSLPLFRGQERLTSTSNVFGVQLTLRSKFSAF